MRRSNRHADLLFEQIRRRYEHKSTAITSTKRKAVVLKNLSAEGKYAFLKKYGYANKTDDIKDEEATAYVVQRISANPEFFQDLRKAMGDKDFAELSKVIISKIKNWFQNPD